MFKIINVGSWTKWIENFMSQTKLVATSERIIIIYQHSKLINCNYRIFTPCTANNEKNGRSLKTVRSSSLLLVILATKCNAICIKGQNLEITFLITAFEHLLRSAVVTFLFLLSWRNICWQNFRESMDKTSSFKMRLLKLLTVIFMQQHHSMPIWDTTHCTMPWSMVIFVFWGSL